MRGRQSRLLSRTAAPSPTQRVASLPTPPPQHPPPVNGRGGPPRSPPPGDYSRCGFSAQRSRSQTTSLIAAPASPLRLRGAEEGGDCGGRSRAAPHGKCSPNLRAGLPLAADTGTTFPRRPRAGHGRLASPPSPRRAPPSPLPLLLPQRGGSGTFAAGRREAPGQGGARAAGQHCRAAPGSAGQRAAMPMQCGCNVYRNVSQREAVQRGEEGARRRTPLPARTAARAAGLGEAGRRREGGRHDDERHLGVSGPVPPRGGSRQREVPRDSAGSLRRPEQEERRVLGRTRPPSRRGCAPGGHLPPVIYSLSAGESAAVPLSGA